MKSAENKAQVELDINASPEKVWDGLTKPSAVKEYMMGAELKTDWKVGSSITWKGEYKGKPFEDKGEVLKNEKPKHLVYTHSSPGAEANAKKTFRTIDIGLTPKGNGTRLTLTQDSVPDEAAKKESEKTWMMMLEGLKKVVEK